MSDELTTVQDATVQSVVKTDKGRTPDGKFAPGNKVAAVSSGKRRALTGVLFETVTAEEFSKSVKNILAISQNPKTPNAAIRAFGVLGEVLGLKQLSLELILGGDDGENMETLRETIIQRMAELRAVSFAIPLDHGAGEWAAGLSSR